MQRCYALAEPNVDIKSVIEIKEQMYCDMVCGGVAITFLNSEDDCREFKMQGGDARIRASRSYPACVLKLGAQKLGQPVSGTARQYARLTPLA